MKKTMNISVVILFTGLLVSGLQAQTNVPPGPIPAGSIWDKAGSPYLIDGDVSVPYDLTINPGVQVLFTGDYLFVIDGVLTAEGTETEHILFSTNTTGVRLGKGLDFNSSASASLLKYCDIEFSNDRGIEVRDCNPVFEYCSLRNNKSTQPGGGLHVSLAGGQTLVFRNCSINDNLSEKLGGGVYTDVSSGSLEFIDCEINSNQSGSNSYGGGLYIEAGNVQMTYSEVSSNKASSSNSNGHSYSYGGGIYVNQGFLSLTCCSVDSNVTYAHGYIPGGSSSANAYSYGAGIYLASGSSGTLKNCQIKSNSTTGSADGNVYLHGGGIYNSSAVLFAENCTVVYNQEEGIYCGGICTILNSILYFNSGTQITGSPTVDYCDVMGGWASGLGNIDEDPKFTNPPGELLLRSSSLCIDAGDPDPYCNDCFFPPSQGTVLNDMGITGGPNAFCFNPRPDIRVNGEDGPLQVAKGTPIDVTVSLEPGNEEGTLADWWIGTMTSFGNYWMRPDLTWAYSRIPVSLGTKSITRLPEKTALATTVPPGSYTFFFILDVIPNGKFDCMAWYDHAVVCVLP